MYTKKDIIKDLKNLGIMKTDTLLVHTSLRSVGKVENGADDVLDAFCEYLSDGLLILPGHTWSTINADNPVYDVKETPVCVGTLPEVFRKRSGVYRSLHPTHSLLAYGNGAKEFVSGQEKFDTPCAPNSCYGKLEKMDAKIMLIGVDFSRCTTIHCIEEVANVSGRLSDTKEQLMIKDENGELISIPSYRHHNANSDNYVKMQPVFERRNALIRGKLGDADVIVCKAKDLFNITLELLSKNERIFDDNSPIPQELY